MTVSKSLRRIGRHCSTPCGRRSICSLRSKPEENAVPAPRTITARTLRIALGVVEGLADLAEHRLIQRVGPLRTVERDARHAVDASRR